MGQSVSCQASDVAFSCQVTLCLCLSSVVWPERAHCMCRVQLVWSACALCSRGENLSALASGWFNHTNWLLMLLWVGTEVASSQLSTWSLLLFQGNSAILSAVLSALQKGYHSIFSLSYPRVCHCFLEKYLNALSQHACCGVVVTFLMNFKEKVLGEKVFFELGQYSWSELNKVHRR